MRLITRYFGLKVFSGIMIVWLFIAGTVSILSFLEILSRASKNVNSDIFTVLKITSARIPYNLELVLPFAILLGSAIALLKLRNHSELVIIFSTGLRLRFLVLIAGVIGFAFGLVLLLGDNFIAKSVAQYRLYERNILALQQTQFNETFAGIKFYQSDANHHHYIQLHYVDTASRKLGAVTVIKVGKNSGALSAHIRAKNAVIVKGGWLLRNVEFYDTTHQAEKLAEYFIPINIDFEKLLTFARPLDTIGFFSLPEFIALSKQTGAHTTLYQMKFWQKIATPFLFAIFAILALGIVRLVPPRAKTSFVILKCFLWALMLNFVTNLISTLGATGQISIGFSMFSQIFICLAIALVILLRPAVR